jgi:hypothetical protein
MITSAGTISAESIRQAAVITRREAAREWWGICDDEARNLLLNDENSTVRNEAVYSQRHAYIAKLSRQAQISAQDVASLDRLGRFSVCDRLWSLCTLEAQRALLNDQHHHVRSAALIAEGQFGIKVAS